MEGVGLGVGREGMEGRGWETRTLRTPWWESEAGTVSAQRKGWTCPPEEEARTGRLQSSAVVILELSVGGMSTGSPDRPGWGGSQG